MSIIFMGTPSFAVPSLRRLREMGQSISSVYSQPDRPAGRGRYPSISPVKQTALELGLAIHQPHSLEDPAEIDLLRTLKPETIIVCAYGEILPKAMLEVPTRGVVNVHPSLLPRHRGPSPIPTAILSGDQETGATIMLTEELVDSGPVIAQRAMPISSLDSSHSLSQKLADLSADLLEDIVPLWLSASIRPQPQDETRASFSKLMTKRQGAIDWSLPATEIWRIVRACNPWPSGYTQFQDERIQIWEAWPLEANSGRSTGTIGILSRKQLAELPSEYSLGGFGVQSGQGTLAIVTGQRAGRRRMTAAELMRGMPELIGGRFDGPGN